MKIWVQYSDPIGPTVPDCVEMEHTEWGDIPPDIYICAVCIQGMWLGGFDSYVVEDFQGYPRFIGWCDDPTYHAGAFYAREIDFPPIAPDPAFAGALNTAITSVWYSEDDPAADHTWAAFVAPSIGVYGGLMLTDDRFNAHLAARPFLQWMDWA